MAQLQLKSYLFPLGLALIATLISAAGSGLETLLRYDRVEILGGQAWRLLSAHITHLNMRHLGMNLAGLGLIWALVGGQLSPRGWVGTLLGNALFVSVCLLVFNPGLIWYVGLSGVLHGLLITGCLKGIIGQASADRPVLSILLILVCAKLGWEQFAGPLPGSETSAGGRVIVDAHFYGGLGGLLTGIYWKLTRKVASD